MEAFDPRKEKVFKKWVEYCEGKGIDFQREKHARQIFNIIFSFKREGKLMQVHKILKDITGESVEEKGVIHEKRG